MQVRKYSKEDYPQICQWALDGYETDYTEEQFPETGFIIDNVAAIFLYKTDSSVCFIENMISNKKSDQAIKDEALNLILEAVFKEARDLGFKVAYATTNIPAVVFRAIRHGANAEAKQVLLTKKLSDLS